MPQLGHRERGILEGVVVAVDIDDHIAGGRAPDRSVDLGQLLLGLDRALGDDATHQVRRRSGPDRVEAFAAIYP